MILSRILRELVPSLVLGFLLFVCLDNVLARNYIEQPSMEPNLIAGQRLVVSRLGISGFTRQAYAATHDGLSDTGAWTPPRGAIVTFGRPDDPDTILIKRVIALPGEEISIIEGQAYINSKPLAEPYVVYRDTRSMPPIRVLPDSIFVMGDNRPSSSDSRDFGPVPSSHLLGVAILRYWPLNVFSLLPGSSE